MCSSNERNRDGDDDDDDDDDDEEDEELGGGQRRDMDVPSPVECAVISSCYHLYFQVLASHVTLSPNHSPRSLHSLAVPFLFGCG